ncbi:MAG: copper resistance protein CopC [Trebonia sp.]
MRIGTGRHRKLAAAVVIAGLLTVTGLGVAAAAPARAATSAPAGKAAPALFAHAALASTFPAGGSVVPRQPEQVTATFDEAIHMTVSSLEVYSPAGDRADDGDTTLANPEEIAVTLLPGLGNGTYTAVWHVISDDTHPVSGEFTFSIGAPSATHVPALEVSSSTVVSAAFTVIRWLEYLTFALLAGAVAFLISCWPAGARRVGVIRLVTCSWAGLLASTLLGLLIQGPYAANEGLREVFNAQLVQATLDSKLGTMSQARELMAFLAGGAASLLLPRLPGAGRRARIALGVAWAVLTTAVAASWALYDHASTGVQAPWGGVPADIVHLDAMAVWIGGLAVLAGFALRGPADEGVATAVPRFSSISLACVATIVVSGAYQTWREVGAWQALTDTSYGRLILAKVTGLLMLIALGYLARRYIQRGLRPAAVGFFAAPTMTTAHAPAPAAASTRTVPPTPDAAPLPTPDAAPGPQWRPAMRLLRRSVAVELLIAAVILAFTSILVNVATGREAYAPTFTASQPVNVGGAVGTATVHVFVGPARLGPNTVDVYFTGAHGSGYAPAAVTAALTYPAGHLGPTPLALTKTAPGQYQTASAVVGNTGQWTLTVRVRGASGPATVSFSFGIH